MLKWFDSKLSFMFAKVDMSPSLNITYIKYTIINFSTILYFQGREGLKKKKESSFLETFLFPIRNNSYIKNNEKKTRNTLSNILTVLTRASIGIQ